MKFFVYGETCNQYEKMGIIFGFDAFKLEKKECFPPCTKIYVDKRN